MDTNYFRRDQIWLINKNPKGESELYSLIEFKELASNINNISPFLEDLYSALNKCINL
ncbi:hypothetical protein K036_4447, partial [Acinetobacter baumannii 42057_5]